MREYLELFLIFFKICGVTFGGGYAMLPLLKKELVDKRAWMTEAEIVDYYAMGQCLPGIIIINVSSFVGNQRKGMLGGIVAALGAVTPSLFVIMIIASVLQEFADNAIVESAFAGIRVCVLVMLINVINKLRKSAVVDKFSLAIMLVVFVLMVFTELSPAIAVVASALIGMGKRHVGGRKA